MSALPDHTMTLQSFHPSSAIPIQRQPTLAASNDVKRPVLCSILDSLVLYMRFNLVRRRFDVDTYL